MANFVFLYPLWLLAIIPLGVILYLYTKGKSSSGLIASHIASRLGIANRKISKNIAVSLISASWLLAVFALAGPSFQKASMPVYTTSSARVLVLDMSRSLYAQDIKPNRLTQVKYKALDILPYWSEGSTGLIAYAGDAYTISPLTTDSKNLENLITNLSPEIMPVQGAAADSAVKLATETLTQAGHYKGDIILISDDIDDREKNAIEEHLHSTPWNLSILAVGTENGAPIPLLDGALLNNASGIPVVAKSNMRNMQSLAQSFGGVFAPVQNDNSDVELIAQAANQAQNNAAKHGSQQINDRVNNGFWLVPILLLPALLLFRKGLLFVCMLTLTYSLTSEKTMASPWVNDNQAAYQQFESEDYQQAATTFKDKKWKGAAEYKAGNFAAAIEALGELEDENSRYNLANAYAQSGQLDKAAQLYEEILANNPNFTDAKSNLDIVKKAQQQQQQQQQNQNSNSSDTQNQQDSSDSEQSDNQSQSENQNQSSSSDNKNTQQDGDNKRQPEGAPSSSPKNEEQENQEQTPTHPDSENKNAADKQNPSKPQKADPAEKKQEDSSEAEAESQAITQADNSQPVDPEFRKLEQVENARDPSRLIQAQMLLQARDRDTPKKRDKSW